jgi:hypothetical protein
VFGRRCGLAIQFLKHPHRKIWIKRAVDRLGMALETNVRYYPGRLYGYASPRLYMGNQTSAPIKGLYSAGAPEDHRNNVLLVFALRLLVAHAASIMDYVQALFSFFIAPLFGTVVLGMLWKRATNAGGFWGLLIGTASSISMFFYTTYGGSAALSRIALSSDARPMAETLYPMPRERNA